MKRARSADIAGLSLFNGTSTAYIAFSISCDDINQRDNATSAAAAEVAVEAVVEADI